MELEAAKYASSILESWNFNTRIGTTVGTGYHNFSATDEERAGELQEMIDDHEIKAVLFGRGGYGVIRILDRIDFSRFRERPKWLCGYSDITALHIHLTTCLRVAGIHSVMCSGITPETGNDQYVDSLRRTLIGERMRFFFDTHSLNGKGVAEGQLIGGNLSLLANLSGTVSQPDTKGKILFIEDVGEYRYSVDRMMWNLQRAGWLDHLSGLIVGSFNEGKETETPFGKTEFEIIKDRVSPYRYPVCFNFPVGHQKENFALKEGMSYTLIVDETCSLIEE
jgi:muramoyltetrapeptide carboxypeptidase